MLLCVESNGGRGGGGEDGDRNRADSDHFFSTLLKQDPFIYKKHLLDRSIDEVCLVPKSKHEPFFSQCLL